MDGQVTITMSGWSAVVLLLSPIIGLGFCLFVAWADEQRWIEDWLDRRRRRRSASGSEHDHTAIPSNHHWE